MSRAERLADSGVSPGSAGSSWVDQGFATVGIRHAAHNLPADLTSFIGRNAEISTITGLLPATRLLTLAGSGGVGKTRLALKAAVEVVDHYRDGVWLVELGSLADDTLVSKAVAHVLGVLGQSGRPLDASLVDALRGCQILLVLDNCEHLARTCAALVETLLRACPALHVMATSRQPLGVPGEIIWRVPPMALPSVDVVLTREMLDRYDATRLFVERARAVLPGLVITEPMASTIARICARLDGIPLAIELAAARLTVLSLAQLDQRLNDRFRVLTTGYRTQLPRHQTLRATVDWSFDLLAETEQILFRRLAVFAGGWTLEAAEAVGADDRVRREEVLDVLSSLVDKSFVLVDQQNAEVRYWLLETLREYGMEKLRSAGEERTMRNRHRDFCVRLVRRAEPMLHREEQLIWFERLDREHDNLRTALAWSQARGSSHAPLVELARRLWWFWYQRGHLAEGLKWIQAALGVVVEAAARVDLLLGAGFLAYGQANLEQAEALFAESLELARAIADRARIGRSLAYLSMTLRDRGDLVRPSAMLDETVALYAGTDAVDIAFDVAFARYFQGRIAIRRGEVQWAADLLDEGLRGFRRLGDRYGIALCLHELGNVALERGDDERASSLFAEVLVVSRELGFPRGICFALQGQATVARRRGDLERATALCRELLGRWRLMGNLAFIARSLEELAAVAMTRQDAQRCVRLLGAATVLRDESKMPMMRLDRRDLDYDRLISSCQARLGAEAFAAAREDGRAMSLDAVTEYACSASGSTPPTKPSSNPPSPAAGPASLLSAREREVAALVARGYSNRAIAEALVIAPRTVDTHVSNILNKLDLHSRAQIAAWSVTRGLVAP